MDEMRKAFEAWATAEPRKWGISRFDGSALWPGGYHSYPTQCAWEAWQAACAAERKESAMNNEEIRKIALACGFTERLQSDGTTDLNAYVYSFARAMFDAGRSAVPAETASVLQALIDFAIDRTSHRYSCDCPDYDDHDRRDPACPVCQAIVQAEKLLTDHAGESTNMVAVPAGWKLVPAEPTELMIAAIESQWMCGSQADMAKREYKAALAVAPEVKS